MHLLHLCYFKKKTNKVEFKEHLQKTSKVLRRQDVVCQEKQMLFFLHTHIIYFGLVLFDEGVSADLEKIKTMVRWPLPKVKTKVKCFWGWLL